MALDVSREQFWRRMVAGWKSSGLSIRQYCLRQALAQPSFYAWRRKLDQRDSRERDGRARRPSVQTRDTGRQQRDRPAAALPLFVPVEVEDCVAEALLEVVVAGNRSVRVRPGFDGATLAQIIAVLEDRPC